MIYYHCEQMISFRKNPFELRRAIFLLQLQAAVPLFRLSGPPSDSHVAMPPASIPHSAQPFIPAPTSNSFSLLTVPPPPLSKNPNPLPDPTSSSGQNHLPYPPLPSCPKPTSDADLPLVVPPPSATLSNPRSSRDSPSNSVPIAVPPPPISQDTSSFPPPPPPPQIHQHRSPTHNPHHQRLALGTGTKGTAPPPHQQSYAQVVRSSRDPSFVRTHANEVESFAKIPRTGVNILYGSKEGVPSFSFVSSELPRVEDLYSNALVMKFHGGRPSLEASHKEILSWGIEHPFSIGPLTSRAFLLRFQNNFDLLKVLTRPSSLLITFPYKIFRWHNLCHLKEDSCLAPVWISLPRLPLQCFIPEFLESVGNKIGRFLCFDKATTTLARPSAARICVELDLRKPPLNSYGCHALGHNSAVCLKTGPDPLQSHSEEQASIPPGRTPPVRHKAPRSFLPNQQEKSNLSNRQPIPLDPKQPPPPSSHLHINHQPEAQPCTTSTEIVHQTTSPPNLSVMPLILPGERQAEPVMPQPTTPHKPLMSSRHQKGKHKCKSVSFGLASTQQQSNLVANTNFWDAVNRQVAILEHARLNHPTNSSLSHRLATPNHTSEEAVPSTLPEPSHLTQSAEDSSGSSVAADSQPSSPHYIIQDAQNPSDAFISNHTGTYDSEGEEPPAEPSLIAGHDTDETLTKLPHRSKRNKRHPDQPLKVQLRVRKDPNTTSLC